MYTIIKMKGGRGKRPEEHGFLTTKTQRKREFLIFVALYLRGSIRRFIYTGEGKGKDNEAKTDKQAAGSFGVYQGFRE